MILLILRKELLEIRRDGRFRLAVAALLLFLGAALLLSYQNYRGMRAIRERVERDQRTQWTGRHVSNPHVAAHSGTVVFRPLPSLSAFDPGVDPVVGTSIFLEAHRRNLASGKPAEFATAAPGFGNLTVAIVLQTLVPLLILVLGFSVFTVEREQGTLRQILSLGVKPRDLAVAKALAIAMPLAVVLIPVSPACAAVIAMDGSSGAAQPLPRMLCLVALYLLYGGYFAAISILVSARASSSRSAAALLLGIWAMTCMVLPRVVTAAIEWKYPTPTADEFLRGIENDKKHMTGFMARNARLRSELMRQYGVTDENLLPVSVLGTAFVEDEDEGSRIQEARFQNLWSIYDRQERAAAWLTPLVPLVGVQAASMVFAGTDWRHYRDFAEAAEAYRVRLVQTMNRYTAANYKPGGARFPVGSDAELYAQVGPFSYRLPGWRWAFQAALQPFALLAVACFIAVTAGFIYSRTLRPDNGG